MKTHFTVRPLLILLAVCLAGCASKDNVMPLSESRYHELVMAAHSFNVKGGTLLEPIRRLNPIEVYHDYGNLVIATYRNSHEEKGCYYYSYTSSECPTGKGKLWSFKQIAGAKSGDPGVVCKYRREP